MKRVCIWSTVRVMNEWFFLRNTDEWRILHLFQGKLLYVPASVRIRLDGELGTGTEIRQKQKTTTTILNHGRPENEPTKNWRYSIFRVLFSLNRIPKSPRNKEPYTPLTDVADVGRRSARWKSSRRQTRSWPRRGTHQVSPYQPPETRVDVVSNTSFAGPLVWSFTP